MRSFFAWLFRRTIDPGVCVEEAPYSEEAEQEIAKEVQHQRELQEHRELLARLTDELTIVNRNRES